MLIKLNVYAILPFELRYCLNKKEYYIRLTQHINCAVRFWGLVLLI